MQISQALRSPSTYDIVELGRLDERLSHLIGFDVGYWGGGNFSLICDAMIWPTWHAPDKDAWAKLGTFVKRLNSSLLFETKNEAQDYLKWYRTQGWAETEPTDFEIIGVGTVDVIQQK